LFFLKFALNMSDKKELEKIDELLGKLIGKPQISDILKTNDYPN